jgi:hypothetical protein
METDTAYFRRRASQERTSALQTRDRRVRAAHLEMAQRYEDLVRSIVRYERFLGPNAEKAAVVPSSDAFDDLVQAMDETAPS